jgi:hypothetical protein
MHLSPGVCRALLFVNHQMNTVDKFPKVENEPMIMILLDSYQLRRLATSTGIGFSLLPLGYRQSKSASAALRSVHQKHFPGPLSGATCLCYRSHHSLKPTPTMSPSPVVIPAQAFGYSLAKLQTASTEIILLDLYLSHPHQAEDKSDKAADPTWDDPLVCRLYTTTIENPSSPFKALSYAWGDDRKTRSIWVINPPGDKSGKHGATMAILVNACRRWEIPAP